MQAHTIGVDFGTNSCRAIVVSCEDGRTIGTGVADYHSGDHGVLTSGDPHLARQNPADYMGSLGQSITAALAEAAATPGFARDRVIGIGTDTTGSTPLPIDAKARPLALDPEFESNLAAYAWLWKDHTAADEAAAITAMARAHAPHYLEPIGGTYSAEWWWAKIWKCLKVAPDVFDAAASWVELADFVPAVLAGIDDPTRIVRCVCAAGHKAMYSDAWGGLPDKAFLARLDPKLADLRDRLYDTALPPGTAAGVLCREWAQVFGLREGIPIAMGGFDAHYGAVGSGIAVGTLVKIIGTSTCDCAIAAPAPRAIPGICGSVNGSILPGFIGIEAGQSAVGDLLNWATEVTRATEGTEITRATEGTGITRAAEGTEITRAAEGTEITRAAEGTEVTRATEGAEITGATEGAEDSRHNRLTREAARLRAGQSGLIALDWHNGNRTVLVDPRLTGLLVGLTLHTTAAEIYRALIEATAFGARVIIDRLREYGVPIERVVCCGGIAEKNDVFMQIYADVIGQPMLIAGSSQAPALGAAISAAVTAGAFPSWTEAQARMTSVREKRFLPDPAAHAVYTELYAIYRDLHDEFGNVATTNLGAVMKQLLDISRRA